MTALFGQGDTVKKIEYAIWYIRRKQRYEQRDRVRERERQGDGANTETDSYTSV